jgi:hypothetical protein
MFKRRSLLRDSSKGKGLTEAPEVALLLLASLAGQLDEAVVQAEVVSANNAI